MMAPWYERARMLGAAIQAATEALQEPIDRLEVDDGGSRITIWAGRKKVSGSIGYADSFRDGVPILGGGHWSVVLGEVETEQFDPA